MRAIVLAVVLAGPVSAQDWTPMDGAKIQTALEDRTLYYEGAEQEFYSSG